MKMYLINYITYIQLYIFTFSNKYLNTNIIIIYNA